MILIELNSHFIYFTKLQQFLEEYQYNSDIFIDQSNAKFLNTNNQSVLLPAIRIFAPDYLQFITTINLSQMGLKKVPLALKECKCLQELNFHDNQLQDLPSNFIIYYFPFLKILDLSKNRLSDLGQIGALHSMNNLEVLNIQGNQIPKSNARIEMLEYLICSQHENDDISKRNFELGMKDNKYSVFLKMGTLETVLTNFSDQLALVVKADEYISKHGLEQFDIKKYQLQTLSVDSFSLTNGSLFNSFEAGGQLYVRGPGFMMWKDRRTDAPFVLVGQISQTILQDNSQNARSIQTMNRMLGHTDSLLEVVRNAEMVPAEVARNGFFGRLFFVYQNPYKPDQYLGDQRLKLTTIELIKKSSLKDPKIDTNIPQAKLEALNVDLYKVMPSEVVKMAKKAFRMHHAYLSNMNDRDTTSLEGRFQRLRMLNGKIITIDEMDKVTQLHQMKIAQVASARSVAYMHCKTTIPQSLKVQCENSGLIKPLKHDGHINTKQINGLAGQDLKEAATQVTQTRPLSEVIRKQQIYNRLLEAQRKERKEALDDINTFLTSGELRKTDDNIGQLAVLLQAYDADKDGSLEEFLQECEELHKTYTQPESSEAEGEQSKLQNTTTKQIVSSVMNATIASLKSNGPFQDGSVVEPLGKTKVLKKKEQHVAEAATLMNPDVSNVIQLTGTVLASAGDGKKANLRLTDLNQTNQSPFDEEDKNYLQELGETLEMRADNDDETEDDFYGNEDENLASKVSQPWDGLQRSSKQVIQKDEERNGHNLKMSLKDQEQIDQLQRSLQQAKQQNYDFEQAVRLARNERLPSLAEYSNAIIGAKSTTAPNPDEAVVAKSTIRLDDVEPMNVMTRNLEVSVNARRARFTHAGRSQIVKTPFRPDTVALNLDNPAITYDTFSTVTTDPALADINQIHSLNQRSSLSPDFRVVMAEEVRLQKQETNELFMHVASNVDKNVRRRLVTKADQWNVDGVKRHSALLDVVLEGDRLSGANSGFKLQSKCIGPLDYRKRNEAQELLKKATLPPPQAKRAIKSPNDALQYTSGDIMDFVDTKLAQQHLQFEWMRHSGRNNVADRNVLMKQLLSTNRREIEDARQKELLKKHRANIELIKREPALEAKKLDPQLALAIKEQRKLKYMKDKLYEQKKASQQRITNEQLKIQQLTDPDTLNPIKIRSKALRKKFSQDVVAPIQVETIEEAAYEANYMKVDAADLIYKSAAIMKSAGEDLAQLEQYSNDFIQRQMAFDKSREDPMRHLLKTENFDDVMADVLASMRQEKPQVETRTFDPTSPIIKSVQATLNGKQTNTYNAISAEFDKVIAEGEKLFSQVQDAIEDV